MKIRTLLLASLVTCVAAFGVPTRRDVLGTTAVTLLTTTTIVPVAPAVAVVSACPPNSKNCIRTTWIAPDGTNVAKSMQAILESYPQEGQNKVDLGGWSIAEGDLIKDGKTRVEYKSGLGNFAKYFNGNKPFVDDLTIEIDGSKIELKSSSRIGESDFDVNRKRLVFLASKAKAIGFETPEPMY